MYWLALGTRSQDYLEGSLSSGVDDGDDLLVGHGLIGLYRDEGLGVLCGEDTQLLLELITGKFGGGAAVDREIIMQVGGQRDACGGRLGSRLRGALIVLGTMIVLVTRKKISRRKMTSVIEAMLKVSATLVLRLSAMRSWVR